MARLRTPEELKNAAPLITYEWYMFRQVGQDIVTKWQAGTLREGWEHDLLLEGLLLHARVLYDFFIQNTANDRVAATHFAKSPTAWRKGSKDLWPYLQQNEEEHYRRLNSKLAHLTFARTTLPKTWCVTDIYQEGNQAWQKFWSMVPADKQPWFERPGISVADIDQASNVIAH